MNTWEEWLSAVCRELEITPTEQAKERTVEVTTQWFDTLRANRELELEYRRSLPYDAMVG